MTRWFNKTDGNWFNKHQALAPMERYCRYVSQMEILVKPSMDVYWFFWFVCGIEWDITKNSGIYIYTILSEIKKEKYRTIATEGTPMNCSRKKPCNSQGFTEVQLRLWRRWALFGQWWWHLQLLIFRCSTWIVAMPGEMFSSFLDLRR
jgi:hypothetical protein